MLRFAAFRLLQALPVLLIVAAVTFTAIRLAPGGPFDDERAAPPEIEAAMNAYYGLDRPGWQQFLTYLGRLLQGDLGPSYQYEGRSVQELIAQAAPVSLELGLYALAVALLIGIPAGTLAAWRQRRPLDHALMSASTLGICLPTFVLGPLLILVFSYQLEWFSPFGWESPYDRVLPSLTLGLLYGAYVARLTRAGMVEILSEDFIRTARAKGLPEALVLTRHAWRGGLAPVVSFLGPAAAGLVTGSFVVETIFFVPGLGRFFVSSVFNRDDTMVMGTVLFYACLIILFNVLVDIAQVALDPRLRTSA